MDDIEAQRVSNCAPELPSRRLLAGRHRVLRRMGAGSLFATLAAVAVGRSLALGVNVNDEAWFLQLVNRLHSGDVLYRDVRVGILPLSVYVVAAPALVLGVQVVVVKLVVAASWAASVLLGLHIASRLGVGMPMRVVLVASMIGFGLPNVANAYNPLTTTTILATAALALAWIERSEAGKSTSWLAVGLGIAAGTAFAVKVTGGAAATIAVGGVIWWAAAGRVMPVRHAVESSLRAAGGFLTVVALVVTPVVVTGGGPELVRQVFDKGAFTEFAGISLGSSLSAWSDAVGDGDLANAMRLAPFALLVLVLVAFPTVVLLRHGQRRRELGALALFLAAACVMVYPRADLAHVSYAMPAVILAMIVGADEVVRRRPARVRGVTAACVAALSLIAVAAAVVPPIQRGLERPTVAEGPLRGARIDPQLWSDLTVTAAVLGALSTDARPVFVLSPRASTLYLLGDLPNPTQFDYPLISQFGAGGIDDVKAALASGEIGSVCVAEQWPARLAPSSLVLWVERTLQAGPELPDCRLHL